MKHILITILISITCCLAGEPVTFVYQGEVAGVMCSACSNHVEAALAKIKGVQTVKVLPGKDGGIPKLEITASTSTITREETVKALGDHAVTYDIRSLKLVRAK